MSNCISAHPITWLFRPGVSTIPDVPTTKHVVVNSDIIRTCLSRSDTSERSFFNGCCNVLSYVKWIRYVGILKSRTWLSRGNPSSDAWLQRTIGPVPINWIRSCWQRLLHSQDGRRAGRYNTLFPITEMGFRFLSYGVYPCLIY